MGHLSGIRDKQILLIIQDVPAKTGHLAALHTTQFPLTVTDADNTK